MPNAQNTVAEPRDATPAPQQAAAMAPPATKRRRLNPTDGQQGAAKDTQTYATEHVAFAEPENRRARKTSAKAAVKRSRTMVRNLHTDDTQTEAKRARTDTDTLMPASEKTGTAAAKFRTKSKAAQPTLTVSCAGIKKTNTTRKTAKTIPAGPVTTTPAATPATQRAVRRSVRARVPRTCGAANQAAAVQVASRPAGVAASDVAPHTAGPAEPAPAPAAHLVHGPDAPAAAPVVAAAVVAAAGSQEHVSSDESAATTVLTAAAAAAPAAPASPSSSSGAQDAAAASGAASAPAAAAQAAQPGKRARRVTEKQQAFEADKQAHQLAKQQREAQKAVKRGTTIQQATDAKQPATAQQPARAEPKTCKAQGPKQAKGKAKGLVARAGPSKQTQPDAPECAAAQPVPSGPAATIPAAAGQAQQPAPDAVQGAPQARRLTPEQMKAIEQEAAAFYEAHQQLHGGAQQLAAAAPFELPACTAEDAAAGDAAAGDAAAEDAANTAEHAADIAAAELLLQLNTAGQLSCVENGASILWGMIPDAAAEECLNELARKARAEEAAAAAKAAATAAKVAQAGTGGSRSQSKSKAGPSRLGSKKPVSRK